MPRTTLDLPLPILRDLKRLQEQEPDKSLGQLAAELIAQGLLSRRGGNRKAPAFRWKTHDMGAPRVDLDDKDAVWAALDADAMRKLGR